MKHSHLNTSTNLSSPITGAESFGKIDGESVPSLAVNSSYIICTNPACDDKGKPKHPDEFHRNSRKKNGRESWCKDCVSKHKKVHHEKKRRKKQELTKRRRNTQTLDVSACEVTVAYDPFKNGDEARTIFKELIDQIFWAREDENGN